MNLLKFEQIDKCVNPFQLLLDQSIIFILNKNELVHQFHIIITEKTRYIDQRSIHSEPLAIEQR